MHKLSPPHRAVAATVASFSAAALLTFAAAGLVHFAPPQAAAATAGASDPAPPATPLSETTIDAFPALAHPDPAAARAIAKPNGTSLYEAHEPGLGIDGAAVLVDSPALSLVLVPKAGNQLCLMRLPASGASTDNCVNDDLASRSGIVNGTPGNVFGLVPHGVDSVRFVLTDGSSAQVSPTTAGYFEAPPEAVGGTFVVHGAIQSLGDLIPASKTPSGMIISR